MTTQYKKNPVRQAAKAIWQRLFFTASLRRALLEAVCVGACIWLFALGIHFTVASNEGAPIGPVAPTVIVTINPLVGLFFALRLTLPAKMLSRSNLYNILSFLLLDLSLNILGTLVLLLVLPEYRGAFSMQATIVVVASVLDGGWYIFVRLSSYALIRWNQLRRRELRWAITHAHVMIVALTMGLLIIAAECFVVFGSNGTWSIFELVPTLFLMLGLSSIPIVIVVPPLALFSHYVTRSTVSRVQTLAKATSALRAGNYAVRVPVNGEDEVAQLQADFNAMAQDLERAMHDLQSERDRVAMLLQERRELIANVSHELRTPVATLRGYLETTLEHWDSVSRNMLQQNIQVMEGETVQLQERIEELFTLARAELGRLPLQCEAVDGAELVQRIVEGSAPLAWRASKIEVSAEIGEQIEQAYADPQRLEQSLRNLLHNALHHTAPGGIVVLSVCQQGHQICFSVKDTGEGIASNDLEHIWERFYQAKNSPMRKRGGTGLGLALVKQWIEGMGGSVEVSSKPGEGSCFHLNLHAVSSKLLKTAPLVAGYQEVERARRR